LFDDIPRNNENINFYPNWGAFYWVTYGKLILKVDSTYATDTASINNPSLDPCQASTPLFKSGSSMVHYKYDFTYSTGTTFRH
jgi:hypothetical protein